MIAAVAPVMEYIAPAPAVFVAPAPFLHVLPTPDVEGIDFRISGVSFSRVHSGTMQGDHRSDGLSGDVGELSFRCGVHFSRVCGDIRCTSAGSVNGIRRCSCLYLVPAPVVEHTAPSPAVGYAVPLLQSVLRQLPYWSSLSLSAVSVPVGARWVASRGLMCFGLVSVGFCHAAREV